MKKHIEHFEIPIDSAQFDIKSLYRQSNLIAGFSPISNDVNLTEETWKRIDVAAKYVQTLASKNHRVYGINTGLGFFAGNIITDDQMIELQRNLIRSHCCGVGDDLPRSLVAAMWLLRLKTFSLGHSGIRSETVKKAIALLNQGILACVPSRGSVGASGDLSPAAHAALLLLGEGMCTLRGEKSIEKVSAAEALKRAKLKPITLAPKEGLSLINGTSLTTALAIENWYESERLWKLAALSAAMTFLALHASTSILTETVLSTHRHEGTREAGYAIGSWLNLGRNGELHHVRQGKRIQDAYSLRCAPQVHGSIWKELKNSYDTLNDEINAATDNPLLFPDSDNVYSCGNFHAIYPARVSDALSSAMTTLASISERRINKAMNGQRTGLPTFLTSDGGLNSGMMMLQVTAAALVSECKALSFPASVDSIPTNCDKEDHVSMGPIAGFKTQQILKNVRHVLSIELLVACQALDFAGMENCPEKLMVVHEKVRQKVSHLTQDRVLSQDVQSVLEVITSLEEEGILV